MIACFVYFALGSFVGVMATVFVWSLCAIAGKTDRQMDAEEDARNAIQ
jgi:hypothetical protein